MTTIRVEERTHGPVAQRENDPPQKLSNSDQTANRASGRLSLGGYSLSS